MGPGDGSIESCLAKEDAGYFQGQGKSFLKDTVALPKGKGRNEDSRVPEGAGTPEVFLQNMSKQVNK